MIYFTSDLHFGHANIIAYCNRPWNTSEEMDEALIKNWNDTVGPEDDVYVLGDFCLRKEVVPAISPRLQGNKILVRGNHDPKPQLFRDAGWVVFEGRSKTMELGGKSVLITHIPYSTDQYQLCGHVHEKWKTRDKTLNIGVDQWEYKPVSLDQVLLWITSMETS